MAESPNRCVDCGKNLPAVPGLTKCRECIRYGGRLAFKGARGCKGARG